MTLWRDPLDELIEQLEATLPARATQPSFELPPPFEDYVFFGDIVLHGSPEEKAGLATNPRFARLRAYNAKLAARRRST